VGTPTLARPSAVSQRRRRHRLALGVAVSALAVGTVSIASAGAAGWSIVSSPNHTPGDNVLTAVSCRPASSCKAVGYSFDTSLGAYQTLIESWNGKRWSIVSSPNAGTSDNDFLGVSCVSANACTAVGFSNSSGVNRTLIESWNGKRWSIVASPNNGTGSNILDGVSCVSANACTAVGYHDDTNLGVSQTLIESWNGTRWSIVPSPSNGTTQNILYGVSCEAARSCTAVGYAANASVGGFHTVIESWNGSSWSLVPSPNIGTSSNLLRVSCRSSSSCQAVGSYGNASLGVGQTLVESWDGTRWLIVPSPNIGTGDGGFMDVSCASANSCEAVGLYFNTSLGSYQTLIESWNGVSWVIVPSPDHSTGYNVLDGVSCLRASRSSCQAVGYYYNTSLNTYLSLIESNN
jgi:hypothetical protein